MNNNKNLEKKTSKSKIIDWALNIGIFLAIIYIIVFWFFLGKAQVSGISMEPTYQNGDKLIFQKNVSEFKRKDVVAIHLNAQYNGQTYKEDIIKRVIGLPGERVKLVNGELFINGKKVKQDFTHNNSDSTKDFGKLKDDEVVVLGDNRPRSLDSRYVGPIKLKSIFGKIISRSWI